MCLGSFLFFSERGKPEGCCPHAEEEEDGRGYPRQRVVEGAHAGALGPGLALDFLGRGAESCVGVRLVPSHTTTTTQIRLPPSPLSHPPAIPPTPTTRNTEERGGTRGLACVVTQGRARQKDAGVAAAAAATRGPRGHYAKPPHPGGQNRVTRVLVVVGGRTCPPSCSSAHAPMHTHPYKQVGDWQGRQLHQAHRRARP